MAVGACGLQLHSPWTGQSWREAVHTCLFQAAVFLREMGFVPPWKSLGNKRVEGKRKLRSLPFGGGMGCW